MLQTENPAGYVALAGFYQERSRNAEGEKFLKKLKGFRELRGV
jgi:hypothetical protein